MGRVFLSYAREDFRRARKVADALETEGHGVWWDSRLKAGSEYSCEIDDELKAADAVVVLWSAAAVKSEWVRDEAAAGKQAGKLVPASLDGTEPPLGFRQHHTIDLGGSGKAGMARLVESVRALTGGEDRQPRQPAAHRRLSVRRAAAAALLVAALAAALLLLTGRMQFGSGANAPVSLAVLPFASVSAAPDTSYLAEGVAEEIATQLSQQPRLRVAGRVTSTQLSKAGDPQKAARKLDIHFLLEGTVRRSGNLVRIDVTLVKLSNGLRVWSQRFDGKLDDIFALQESIGRDVTRQLVSTVAVASRTRKAKPEAYALYLTARQLMRERERGNMRTAAELLQQAVALDPGFASAWAGLGAAQYHLAADGANADVPASQRLALGSIGRALKLDPNLAEAHAAKGYVLGYSNPEGVKALERAAALNPADAEVQLWLGNVYGIRGDHGRQLGHYLNAISIDPLWVRPLEFAPSLAWQLGDHESALSILRRFEAAGDPSTAQYLWGLLAKAQGDFSEAARRYETAMKLDAETLRHAAQHELGAALWMLGDREGARRLNESIDANWALLHGHLPPLAELRTRSRNYGMVMQDSYFVALAVEAYLHAGRGAELVPLYDRHGLIGVYPPAAGKPEGDVMELVQIAIALRQAQRSAEAEALLDRANAAMAERHRYKVPKDYYVAFAAFWSVRGEPGRALEALERAAQGGWIGFPAYLTFGLAPPRDHCRQASFAPLRGVGRFERICAQQRAHIEKERREYLAGR